MTSRAPVQPTDHGMGYIKIAYHIGYQIFEAFLCQGRVVDERGETIDPIAPELQAEIDKLSPAALAAVGF